MYLFFNILLQHFHTFFFLYRRHDRRHFGPHPFSFFFLFSYPIMPPQFLSNLSSLPAPSLPFAGFGFWVTFFLLVFISNWHFVVFNLQGGTMGTFYYTEWYEKPQNLWMWSERQNKTNKWVSQTGPGFWWQENHSGGQFCISAWECSLLSVTLFHFFPFLSFIVSLQPACSSAAEIFTDNIRSSRKNFVKRKGRGTCTCALPLCMHVDHYLTGILTAWLAL